MTLLEILARKILFKKPNGDEVVDLTRASLEYNKDISISTYTMVTNGFEMRPDLISESVYGSANKWDYILKFNGISNPLSINSGDVLYIPVEEEMASCMKTPKPMEEAKKKESVTVKPTTKKDEKRMEILKKKAQRNTILPPNVNNAGEENILFTEEKIIFGGSVSNVNPSCPDNISRARLKQKLLAKKISG